MKCARCGISLNPKHAHHANASPDGIHGQRRAWKLAQVDEMDALAWTLEALNAQTR